MSSTALVRVRPPSTDQRPFLRALFRGRNIAIRARDGFDLVFRGIDTISKNLRKAIKQLEGVSIEIDQLVALPPETLTLVLQHCTKVMRELGNDLKSFEIDLDRTRGKIRVTPMTWSNDQRQIHEGERIRAYSYASQELDLGLAHGTSKEAAEKIVAGLLFRFFKVTTFKVYDVAFDGSVRLAYAFKPEENGEARKVEAREVRSHFADWVPPDAYVDEAMGEILFNGRTTLLVHDPESSPWCVKTGRDGRVTRYESAPFALIAEEIGGNIDRVYKLDWNSRDDLSAHSGGVLWGLLKRVADFKKRINAEAEKVFLDDLTRIAAEQSNLDEVLEATSIRISQYFDGIGGRPKDNKVSIMLFDELTKSLVTRVICSQGEISRVDYYEGLDAPSIGVKLFQLGTTTYLRRLADWSGDHVAWRNEGRGSLLGTVVANKLGEKLGVIIVSSSSDDAFTQDLVRLLDGISQRIAQPFERIIKSMEALNLDANFGVLYEGSVAKSLLPREIQGNEKLLGQLFVDPRADNLIPKWAVDVLEDLVNQAISNAELRRQLMATLNQALETKVVYKVYSKKYLLARLEQNLDGLRTTKKPVSIIFCDIDWFKQTNEGLGHEVADLILKEVLLRIHSVIRDGEVYRYGGEETAVRLDVPLVVAERVAERMRTAVEKPMEISLFFANRRDAASKMRELNDLLRAYPESGLVDMKVVPRRNGAVHLVLTVQKTISLGVAVGRASDTPEILIGRADSAQREAKRDGKNRVKVES